MKNKELSTSELNKLISLAKRVLWSSPETRQKIQAHKVNIVPANFYSEIPTIEEINSSFEYSEPGQELYNDGLFDPDLISDFVSKLCDYSAEFNPPMDGDPQEPCGFFWKNPAFSYSDAMSYYCVLRHFKPENVLEIGSGFSTLVANQALLKNGRGEITLIEPYPKPFLKDLETVKEIKQVFAQNIPVKEFVALVEQNDIWFIDSTHTVKIGSDCLYIYLKVMPNIRRDIIVHTHDVNLPYGISQKRALEKHIYWTEQYLLYAYMLDNPKIEILFGSAFVKKTMPDKMNELMREKYPGGGGSLWYRLNGTLS